jgi:hypothetical protein
MKTRRRGEQKDCYWPHIKDLKNVARDCDANGQYTLSVALWAIAENIETVTRILGVKK